MTAVIWARAAIVKFAEDCGEIDIEFGEEALFTVNASGQGKLNLKYTLTSTLSLLLCTRMPTLTS